MTGGWVRGSLGLALMLTVAAAARAETIIFVNETKTPVVVQVTSVVGGSVRRDRPRAVQPGDRLRLTLPGNKLVNLYDARLPNRILFQGPIPGAMDDQAYSIQLDPASQPKLRLVPIPVPPPPAGAKLR